ncbi:hypothetical protein N7492_000036 [Penicillium capsulatum]|uniref:Uncharacterized protein n=1 Tax=Penicillium capsulatum TaxID=69766 RepID=A0A9W9IPP5_9EURO|nr:hypothetical protein N7492_000036 [Penicillium capsulatum]KAJ6130892.1 hypothetical protein N7512_003672 [Penicillium capsulatum]
MRGTFRILITLVLVVTILLVRHHLTSIDEQWQSSHHANQASIVVKEGGWIELDSSQPDVEIDSNPQPVSLPSLSPSPSPSTEAASATPESKLPQDRPMSSAASLKTTSKTAGRWNEPPKPKASPKTDRIVVMPAMLWEDVSWLEDELPEWQHAVYRVDDPDATLKISQNKGKEGNAYLQYITDHYDHLPEYMVFLHSHQFSHHVELPEQDNALTVRRLQLEFLKQTGYVSLRCEWDPGCPDEVHPFRQLDGRTTEIAFAGAWMRIFNNTHIPEVIAAPCCAQFAVTREQVLARPRSDYQRYHQWLMETELDDETSGRVLEYLWHIIFGRDAVFCPSKKQCYHDVYDIEYVPRPSKSELITTYFEDEMVNVDGVNEDVEEPNTDGAEDI